MKVMGISHHTKGRAICGLNSRSLSDSMNPEQSVISSQNAKGLIDLKKEEENRFDLMQTVCDPKNILNQGQMQIYLSIRRNCD
jgi:hypothetical protein